MTKRTLLESPVPGTTIAIDRSGDSAAQTLVWLHGEFGALEGAPSRDRLAEQFDLVEAHLPGFGESDGGNRFDDISDLASVMWWAIENLDDAEAPIIAGHGLGATLAVEMGIQQPTAISGLMLATPFGMFDVDDTGVDVFALIPRDLVPHLYADPSSDLVAVHFPPTDDPHERGLAAIRRVEVLGASSRYLFPIPDTNVEARAYRLANVPTTIWFGGVDGVVPPSLAGAWAQALPHADIRTVPDTAHMLPYEYGAFADEMMSISTAGALSR